MKVIFVKVYAGIVFGSVSTLLGLAMLLSGLLSAGAPIVWQLVTGSMFALAGLVAIIWNLILRYRDKG